MIPEHPAQHCSWSQAIELLKSVLIELSVMLSTAVHKQGSITGTCQPRGTHLLFFFQGTNNYHWAFSPCAFLFFQKNCFGFYSEKYQDGKRPSVSNSYLRFAEASVILRMASSCVIGENVDIRITG